MTEPEPPGVPPRIEPPRIEPSRIELDPHPEPEPRFNPYQPPLAPRLEVAPTAWESGTNELVPWEDETTYPGVFDRWWATIRLAFTDPMGLCDRIPTTSGMLPAWLFMLIAGIPATILSQVLGEMVRHLMASFLHTQPHTNPAVQLGAAILGLLIGIFIGGAFVHLFLWMWGGAKEGLGLNQTIRFTGYAYGAYYLIGWVPLLNIPLGILFWVFFSMGLARTHRTDTWRGFAATLTPVVAACCVGIGAAALLGTLMRH